MTGMFDSSPTLQRTAEQVFSVPDLREKLDSGRPLRIKYGVDVTAPFLLTDPDQRHPVTSGAVLRVGRRRWFRITFGDERAAGSQ